MSIIDDLKLKALLEPLRNVVVEGGKAIDDIVKKISDIDMDSWIDKDVGEFYDLPKDHSCPDKQHLPPYHLYIPYGKGYRHTCPTCKKVTEVTSMKFN